VGSVITDMEIFQKAHAASGLRAVHSVARHNEENT
jgi:hypothetical protein